ncbi:hypothetical protein MLD38_011733 [Melastoma candidum]|uniref:Uncharacterized protein n=1 Tax=Melastoma candidum TaxID=119954 RepID=A0ACB9RCC0_9MYRT|nr:hypothetical protein MLD38_011733 [Melastoma candidum]
MTNPSMGKAKAKRVVGKYELWRTVREGTFAKVKFARNMETGESVAVKILDKVKVLKNNLAEQSHLHIALIHPICCSLDVFLSRVMGSKTKIYIFLEFATGGELFDKIVSPPKLMHDDDARKYFQQLINAVHYYHSRGVYHRDLKPENLLSDGYGNLKVANFGLSALSQQVRVMMGAMADLWSCGVILFVLLAGYLPFDHPNLLILYEKVIAELFQQTNMRLSLHFDEIFESLNCFGLFSLLKRINVPEVLEDKWFKKEHRPPEFDQVHSANVDDVKAVFQDSEVSACKDYILFSAYLSDGKRSCLVYRCR